MGSLDGNEPRSVFVVCPKCGGDGVVSGCTYFQDYRCDECDGSGAIEEEVKLVTQDDLDEMEAEEELASVQR